MELINQTALSNITNGLNQAYWDELQNGISSLGKESLKLTCAASALYVIERATSIVTDTLFSTQKNQIQAPLAMDFCDDKYCHPLTSYLSKVCYLNKVEQLFPKLLPLQDKPSDVIVYSDGHSITIPGWGWVQHINKLISSEKSLKGNINFNPTKVAMIFKSYIQSMVKHGFNINEDLLWQDIKPLRKVAQEDCEILTQTFIDLGANISAVTKSGLTSLPDAAQGHRNVSKLLTNPGTDDNTMVAITFSKGESALDQTIVPKMVESYVNAVSKNPLNDNSLEWNVRSMNLKSIESLLKAGVSEQEVQRVLKIAEEIQAYVSHKLKVDNPFMCGAESLPDLPQRIERISILLKDYLSNQTQELQYRLLPTIIHGHKR